MCSTNGWGDRWKEGASFYDRYLWWLTYLELFRSWNGGDLCRTEGRLGVDGKEVKKSDVGGDIGGLGEEQGTVDGIFELEWWIGRRGVSFGGLGFWGNCRKGWIDGTKNCGENKTILWKKMLQITITWGKDGERGGGTVEAIWVWYLIYSTTKRWSTSEGWKEALPEGPPLLESLGCQRWHWSLGCCSFEWLESTTFSLLWEGVGELAHGGRWYPRGPCAPWMSRWFVPRESTHKLTDYTIRSMSAVLSLPLFLLSYAHSQSL